MNWPNISDEEKERLKNYVSPYEIKMMERVNALDERGLVKKLLYFLDKEEESDSGRVFRPNYISSVRCLDGAEMNQILKRLKELHNDE